MREIPGCQKATNHANYMSLNILFIVYRKVLLQVSLDILFIVYRKVLLQVSLDVLFIVYRKVL